MSNIEVVDPVKYLGLDERKAYDDYVASGRPPLSPKTSLELWGLFVQGVSCQEIARLNPGLGLGMITKARVEHRWDERRDAYMAELYVQAGDRLRQSALESANFLGQMLAAAHKLYGDKLKKFLQSGDPEDLGDLQISSIKGYKDVVETLAKITGADNKKTIKHEGNVGLLAVQSSTGATTGALPARMTPEQADALRISFEKNNKD